MRIKLPLERAKYYCDRVIEIKREYGLSWKKCYERAGISESVIHSCFQRAYPNKKYCPFKKELCACVILGSRQAKFCRWDENFIPFKILVVCPKDNSYMKGEQK